MATSTKYPPKRKTAGILDGSNRKPDTKQAKTFEASYLPRGRALVIGGHRRSDPAAALRLRRAVSNSPTFRLCVGHGGGCPCLAASRGGEEGDRWALVSGQARRRYRARFLLRLLACVGVYGQWV
jgi:hypothetical protein